MMTKTVSKHGLISHHIKSHNEGVHLLVIGNIHGNETCGTLAINQLVEELNKDKVELYCGALTLVPSCNPTAHISNTRAVNVDMNRIIGRTHEINQNFYEVNLAKELEQIIQKCDVLLSIHACSAQTSPFAIRDWDTDQQLNQWSHSVGVNTVVTGWENIHPSAGDTASYAKSFGKKSLTIECGQISDANNVYVAYQAIIHSLQFWNLSSIEPQAQIIEQEVVEVEMMQEVVRPLEGFCQLVTDKPYNLQSFQEGDILSLIDDVPFTIAPYKGVFVMPKFDTEPGESWFYLAKERID